MTEKLPLVDIVRELTQTTSHREAYAFEHHDTDSSTVVRVTNEVNITIRPSLIQQLRVALTASASTEDGCRPGYASKPSARIDALDALIRIDQGAVRWLHHILGEGDQLVLRRRIRNAPTETLVGKLAANRGAECDAAEERRGCCQAHDVERDIRAWWVHSRIVAGWDAPAFRPHNTCPTCRKRGGLRVRIDREASQLVAQGVCVECKTTWSETDGTFEKLAWHIRVENDAPKPRQMAGA